MIYKIMNDDEYYLYEYESELRNITLELMKLAYMSGKPFKTVAKEYVKNVLLLHRMIEDLRDES